MAFTDKPYLPQTSNNFGDFLTFLPGYNNATTLDGAVSAAGVPMSLRTATRPQMLRQLSETSS